MASMLASNVVDRGFDRWSDQTKDYKNRYVLLLNKNTQDKGVRADWLTRNQENVFEWSDMSTNGLLSQ